MGLLDEYQKYATRREFLMGGSKLLGGAFLAGVLGAGARGSTVSGPAAGRGDFGVPGLPHFAPTAKRVIQLTMVGGPSQLDLFDHKPGLEALFDKDLPPSVIHGQRLTTMTSEQKRLPVAPSKYQFAQYGQSGAWVSELMPHFARCVDEVCFIRSMHTDAINHEPGITFLQTGNQVAGKPSMGSWLGYGLGTERMDLPAYVVLMAQCTNREQVQALSSGLWSAGNLPGKYAGVFLRGATDPILYLNNPAGIPKSIRRGNLDAIQALNEKNYRLLGDPNIHARMEQYEMAYQMQSSVPALANLSDEPPATYQLYGSNARQAGSFANAALMARRLVERGVRFVQIFHNNWDTHSNTAGRLPSQCADTDQACAALIKDLKQRGLLESTLVIWGGEFGRTVYCQGDLTRQNYGRDHHGRCFTMWMAGGGVRPGLSYGETDDFSYSVVRDPVSVHDLHATVLHLLGIRAEQFSVKTQGLENRLTGVEPARVVTELLA